MRIFASTAIPLLLAAAIVAGCSHAQQSQAQDQSTPAAMSSSAMSPQASAAASAAPVAFTDIAGLAEESAIRDEASLGVFDATSGAFNPQNPISRADFVRWLVKADDAYFANDPSHRIHPAEGGPATFVDVPATDPNFPYIQGLANAGYVIGKDAKHFAPAKPITREEMISIKAQVDEGGAIASDPGLVQFLPFSDKSTINVKFLGAVHEDFSVRTTQNIGRVWGSIKVFHPRQAVTRAEAAAALAQIASGSAAATLGRSPAPQ